MSAKEVAISYLKHIKRNLQGVLETQIKHNISEMYIFDTMEYLVGINLAIEAVEKGEGE